MIHLHALMRYKQELMYLIYTLMSHIHALSTCSLRWAVRSYDGPLQEEKALLRAAEGGLSSAEYVELCRWLSSRLEPLCGLEESITSGPGESRASTPAYSV